MSEITINLNGEELTYSSKKDMMQRIGYAILDQTDDKMTLRQLYYRFVALDLIDNKQSQYQYLGTAIKEARLDGMIPWDWIEDRTRSTAAGDHNDGKVVTPASRFAANLDWFKNTPDRFFRPRWQHQENYIEVWVEKEALAGVFANICNDLKVVSFPNRGYTSITLLKEAADRIKEETRKKVPPMGNRKQAHILYFGDFDPSGQDIERNIRDKLQNTFHVDVTVTRKALTRKQINKHKLPPQPAKSSDSRYEDFVAEHGNIAVELDALPPSNLKQLIRDSVDEYFDQSVYKNKVLPEQKKEREQLENKVNDILDE